MAINLQSLVEQGANVRIEITAADLKMLVRELPSGLSWFTEKR